MTLRENKFRTIDSKVDLLEMQRFFAGIIRTPLDKNNKIKSDPLIAELIKPNKHFSSEKRLEIYAKQYWSRILSSFDEDFPTLAYFCDAALYRTLRLDYLSKNFSTSFTLRHLGYKLPLHIQKSSLIPSSKKKILFDAARFDVAKLKVFEAARYSPIQIEDMQNDTIYNTKLYLQPCVALLSLRYRVNTLASEHESEKEELSNTQLNDTTELFQNNEHNISKENTYVAVHRLENKVYTKNLTSLEFKLLQLFQEGLTIRQCTKRISTYPQINQDEFIKIFFESLMSLQWLYINDNEVYS